MKVGAQMESGLQKRKEKEDSKVEFSQVKGFADGSEVPTVLHKHKVETSVAQLKNIKWFTPDTTVEQ